MTHFGGKIITFSGIDGAGKSTQINLFLNYLKRINVRPVYLWTRGGYTGPFNSLKRVFRRLLGKRLPPPGRSLQREQVFGRPLVRKTWLFLAIIDLILVYGVYVRFCKIIGRVVLADRYLWDTWIDFRLNFPQESTDRWFVWRLLLKLTPKPDSAFLLVVPVEDSLLRSKQKNEPFPDSEEVLRSRLCAYETLASSIEWHKIDCILPVQKIHQDLLVASGYPPCE